MKLSPEDLELVREKNPELFAAILAKLEKERPPEKKFLGGLSYTQKQFVLNKNKKRAAVCSRRAGKSHAIAVWMLEGGFDNPNELSLYIAQSKALARKIMGKALEQINRDYDLNLRFHEIDGQLHCTLPNGHKIWLAGCRDYGEVDKFRGVYLARVCIDEAQSYGSWLQELIDDVLEPALLDLNGDMALTGTPCPIPAGYFYEATTGDGTIKQWPTYHWTCVQNPYIQRKFEDVTEDMLCEENHVNPHSLDYLEAKKKQNNWDEDNPTYRREWMGQWVLDKGALVYPYDASKNTFSKLPEGDWNYSIALDVGYIDDTAWTVAAYQRGLPSIYFVECIKKSKLIPSAVAVFTEKLMKKYDTSDCVIDSGGLGKGYQMEMFERYGIWCEPAKKSQKRGFQATIAGELKSGNIKFNPHTCSSLIDEMLQLVWKDSTREKESDEMPNHACDSMLYNARNVRHWYEPEENPEELSPAQTVNLTAQRHREKISQKVKEKISKRNKRGGFLRDIRNWR